MIPKNFSLRFNPKGWKYKMSWVLILGAKSDIAKAIAHRFAKAGHNLYLAARNADQLNNSISDLQIRYPIKAKNLEWDAHHQEKHGDFYDSLEPKPDVIIAVAGYMGEQKKAQEDIQERKLIIDTNYSGIVSLLEWAARDFEQKNSGFIIGISSVAGDRGRQSNYLYGSAKAAFTSYLSGLRNRLYPAQVQVLTVKPGFVATAMTQGMDLPRLLTASPEKVAKDVFKAYKKKKCVIYTPWYWRWIMAIIKGVPEKIFRKLKL